MPVVKLTAGYIAIVEFKSNMGNSERQANEPS